MVESKCKLAELNFSAGPREARQIVWDFHIVEERRFSAAARRLLSGLSAPVRHSTATTGAEAHVGLIHNAALEGPLFHVSVISRDAIRAKLAKTTRGRAPVKVGALGKGTGNRAEESLGI